MMCDPVSKQQSIDLFGLCVVWGRGGAAVLFQKICNFKFQLKMSRQSSIDEKYVTSFR